MSLLPLAVEPTRSGVGSWYHLTVYRCPDCGDETRVRERRYTRRPGDARLRRLDVLAPHLVCVEARAAAA